MPDTDLQPTTPDETAIAWSIFQAAADDTPRSELRKQISAAIREHREPEQPPETLTREDLLAICRDAFVPQHRWYDRDSSAAQRQLGEAYALLMAGCSFVVEQERDTLWVRITYRGFDSFEWGEDDSDALSTDRFYLPTRKRLRQSDGGDWY